MTGHENIDKSKHPLLEVVHGTFYGMENYPAQAEGENQHSMSAILGLGKQLLT